MNLIIIKKLVLVCLVAINLTLCAAGINIKSIYNFAGYKAIICNRLGCTSISPHSKKMLHSSFGIPFISIKRNLKQFVKDIPFVPSNALKITVQKGVFYIWRNESGVVCAPDPKNPEALAMWKLKILLDKKMSKNTHSSALALEIYNDGNLEVKQHPDLPKGKATCLKDINQI